MTDKDTTIMTVAYLITAFLLALFVNYNTKLGIEQDLKRGKLRLFDNQYSCQMTGRYVSDERFIPSTVTMEDLPKEIQDKLKWKIKLNIIL